MGECVSDGQEEMLGLMKMFIILVTVMVSGVHIAKINQICSLWHFNYTGGAKVGL